ncbi:hypothetical protein RhiirA5_364025, partial [Rhizophagus irregularis]
MTAIPMSSTPEDSTKKPSSKPKSVKSVSPTSSKTSASQSQIALKKQKPATTVRQPVSEMATSFGKKSSAHDSFVSDDDKSIKRTKQSETSTATASINRSANANISSTVRTSNGGVVKRVREGEDSTSFTGKKVRTDKVSGPQTSTATQGTDSSNSRLILEREVRQIINKNSELTVTTIIKAFRKRIHEDARNKERLLEITKNIAVLKNGYLVL